jgi:hypothetical protein
MNHYDLSQIPYFVDTNDSVPLTVHQNPDGHRIIRYDKKRLTPDLISSYGLCRSIVMTEANEIVCFSPPKSLSAEAFMSKYPTPDETIVAEEFVEGTMINVFWSGSWQIATRSTVGATTGFYNKKTFRDMFFEAALNFEKLDQTKCYSFVLQHPDNRIVVPILEPRLFLVGVYSIRNKFEVFRHDLSQDLSQGLVSAPTIYGRGIPYTELAEKYASMNTPYTCMGVVIYNKVTGERTKLRNPVYENVRKLRGNQPKLEYQYLCLRKKQKVDDFLKYYPESKKKCMETRNRIHEFTVNLYSNYVSCYIKKEKPLIEYSKQYRTHMFHIHQHIFKEQKKHISKNNVIQYVNDLHPSLLMHSINYTDHV